MTDSIIPNHPPESNREARVINLRQQVDFAIRWEDGQAAFSPHQIVSVDTAEQLLATIPHGVELLLELNRILRCNDEPTKYLIVFYSSLKEVGTIRCVCEEMNPADSLFDLAMHLIAQANDPTSQERAINLACYAARVDHSDGILAACNLVKDAIKTAHHVCRTRAVTSWKKPGGKW